jgi:Flp pilus assembly protein TadD
MRLRGYRILVVAAALLPNLWGAGELDRAKQLYARADYRGAIRALEPLADSSDSTVQAMLGKARFMSADYKKAAEHFEKAIVSEPNSSELHHWLGKAFGRRAETSSMLTAPMLANKARQSFEKAVELNGKNLEAVNDLFSYYVEAPGFLGGGLEKAAALAKSHIQPNDPVEFHYAMAQLSEKRKEFKSAEFHFRQAFQMAPKSVGRAIDLARFLSKQGRMQESEAVLAQAEKIAPNSPRLMFEKASVYIRSKKNIQDAKHLLEQYLKSSLTPDDPPRSEAEKLLKQAASLGA